jgi:hypothetical protein
MAILLVVLICVAYGTTLSTKPRFSIETPASKPLRPIAAYEQAGEKIFNESLWSKNKLTINTQKLTDQLQQEFPELSDVSITLPLMGHRPGVVAIAEQPALLLSTRQGMIIIGTSGKALAKVTDLPGAGDLVLPTVQDEADLRIETGKGALSAADVTFITTLVKQFESQKLSISSLTLPALASELHVRIAGAPYYIKFSLLTDSRVAAGQYFALRKRLEAEKVVPKEYVDSRVEERVYYK